MTEFNEISVAVAGLIALWAMYYFLFKVQRLDRYREELFRSETSYLIWPAAESCTSIIARIRSCGCS
jgi:hypothetical protein